jgi:hypothetical protein
MNRAVIDAMSSARCNYWGAIIGETIVGSSDQRELRPMSMRSKSSFGAALVLAAFIAWVGSSPAHSQSYRSRAMLPPSQIQRMLEASGYRLTGPIIRRGGVYLADVLGQEDNPEQFVIDTRDGRLLHRHPGSAAMRRRGGAPDEWSPVTSFFDGLFGHNDDVAPLSPPPAADFFEPPKPRMQTRRPKSEATPVAQRAKAPTDNTATPIAPAATAPSAATVAPSVPSPKISSPKLNDVPVAPLE